MGNPVNMTERLLPALNNGWYWTNEGKLKRHTAYPLAHTPWSYHNMQFQCVKWHYLFFDLASNNSMVHSHCQDCFKVVIAPRTVEELMELEKWQSSIKDECKCGIELREFVKTKRLYGGYWYNRGVEAGRACYEKVKAWADFIHQKDQYENIFLQRHEEPMPVILKLGCTEFERALGDSRKYEVTKEQEKFEEYFENLLDFDPFETPEGLDEFPQPEALRQHVRVLWLKWAHNHGDMTYLKYMPDGEPFDMPHENFNWPPATYHGEESAADVSND